MICWTPLPVRLLLVGLLSTSLCYAGKHPTRVDETSNCLECHADKINGQDVHPALKKGCVACHAIENKDDTTYVNLKLSPAVGCFACHQQQPVFLYSHFPYSSGMCLRCHDPHSSAYPKLVKDKVNDLCLACHLRSTQGAQSPYLPTIALVNNNTIGHPYAQHPVSGKPDPLTGGELSCISCHTAHGGAKKHLLKMAGQIPEDALNEVTETRDMCSKCHQVLWGVDPATSARKKHKGR
ncbi:MAG: cytochrome c3 family protein [Acidobacteriia bacterium]|nr:cytochrome c3 family protein [Terriglobia bacterium]